MNKYEKKKNKTKSKLKVAFYEMAKKNSILNIYVKDICDAAKIARSTFYVHYDDIEAFFRETAIELLAEIEEQLFHPHLCVDKEKMLLEGKPQYYYEMDYFLTFLQQNRHRILPFIYPEQDSFFINNFKLLVAKSIKQSLHIDSHKYHNDECFAFSLNLSVSGTMFHFLKNNTMSKEELLDVSLKFRELYMKNIDKLLSE